jgi:hypothetical protein
MSTITSNSPIATICLTLDVNVKIFQGSHGKYYCVDYKDKDEESFPIYYDIHFPLNWIFDEELKMIPWYNHPIDCESELLTGPNHCNNCKYFGYYNGVFIGYCMNCASEFENSRGNGLTDMEGVELNENMVAIDLTYFSKEKSMWNTYLKGVSLDEIGDNKLKEDFEMYKDLPDLISIDEEEEERKKANNLNWYISDDNKEEDNKEEDDNSLYELSDYMDDSGDEWEQNQIDKLIDRFSR